MSGVIPASLAAALGVGLSFIAVAGSPASAVTDPLASRLWTHRVLLMLGAGDDPRMREQRLIFEGMSADADARDLVLVEVRDGTPQAETLRRRFGLGSGFHALLIGKDGGAKLGGDVPLRAEVLIPTIDAMPMRREEMRQRP